MIERSSQKPMRWPSRRKYPISRKAFEHEPGTCASCEGPIDVSAGLFCSECLAWSKQSQLDENWDDLGVGD